MLERMNATVRATNESILSYDFMPTKSTLYREEARASSLSRLKYRQAGTDQLAHVRGRVNSIQEGDEAFY
jgi:hypothetical protein